MKISGVLLALKAKGQKYWMPLVIICKENSGLLFIILLENDTCCQAILKIVIFCIVMGFVLLYTCNLQF